MLCLAVTACPEAWGSSKAGPTEVWRDGPYNLYRWLSRPQDVALNRDWETFLFSSRDPGEGENDFNHYLGEVEGKKILAEVEGPGAVSRLWFTGSTSMGGNVLIIEVDGVEVLRTKLNDLIRGDVFPFVAPLVGKASGGGSFCFVPIPFKQSCRVLLELRDSLFHLHYYQVQGMKFPSDQGVNSFRLPLMDEDDASIRRAVENWSAPPDELSSSTSEIRPVTAGLEIFRATGSGIVREWEIRYAPDRMADLRGVFLTVEDGTDTLFSCPLSALAGMIPTSATLNTQLLSFGPGRIRCCLPMVHDVSMAVVLSGTTEIITGAAFRQEPLAPGEAERFGKLRIAYGIHRPNGSAFIPCLIQEGRGHLVGLWMRTHGNATPQTELNYLEGDDLTFLDDAPLKALKGTGMEDYFNAAFYFSGGVTTFPNHGITYYDPEGSRPGETELVFYRLMTTDAVRFQESIRFLWEAYGVWKTGDLEMETLFFWYDCTNRPVASEWPDHYNWDLNRDDRVDGRDLSLSLDSLQEKGGEGAGGFPWPFRFHSEWSLFPSEADGH